MRSRKRRGRLAPRAHEANEVRREGTKSNDDDEARE